MGLFSRFCFLLFLRGVDPALESAGEIFFHRGSPSTAETGSLETGPSANQSGCLRVLRSSALKSRRFPAFHGPDSEPDTPLAALFRRDSAPPSLFTAFKVRISCYAGFR